MTADEMLPFCDHYDLFFTRNICVEDDKDEFYNYYLMKYWSGYVLSARWTWLLIYFIVVARQCKTLRLRVTSLFVFGLFLSSKQVVAPTVLSCCYDFYYIEYLETLLFFYYLVSYGGCCVAAAMTIYSNILQDTELNLFNERSPLAYKFFIFGFFAVAVPLLTYLFLLHYLLIVSISDSNKMLKSLGILENIIVGIVLILILFAYCYYFLRIVIYLSVKKYCLQLNGICTFTTAINIFSLYLSIQLTNSDWSIPHFVYCELGTLLLILLYRLSFQKMQIVSNQSLYDNDEFIFALENFHRILDYVPQFFHRMLFRKIYRRFLKKLANPIIRRSIKRDVIHSFAKYILPNVDVNSRKRESGLHALDVVLQTQNWELFLVLHRAGVAYRLPLSGGKTFLQTLEEKVAEWPLSKQDEVWVRIYSCLSAYRNNALFLLWLHTRNISPMRRLPLELVREVHSFL